jgi:hypothetical protein
MFGGLRQDVRDLRSELRTDMRELEAGLRSEIRESAADLRSFTIKLYAVNVTTTLGVIAAILARGA